MFTGSQPGEVTVLLGMEGEQQYNTNIFQVTGTFLTNFKFQGFLWVPTMSDTCIIATQLCQLPRAILPAVAVYRSPLEISMMPYMVFTDLD